VYIAQIPQPVSESRLTSNEIGGMTGLLTAPRGWHWVSADDTPPSFHIADRSWNLISACITSNKKP